MTEEEKKAIREFLAEYWSRWEGHCSDIGVDAQKVYTDLGGED